jgi:hypothetical protein
MTNRNEFHRFQYLQRDGLHLRSPGRPGDLPGPVWPGIWKLDYLHEPDANPW